METYKRKEAKKYSNLDKNAMMFFVPYWIIAFILTLFVFVILGLLYIFTPLSNSALPAIVRIAVLATEFFMAYLTGKFSRFPAVIAGAFFGLGYTVILLFLGICTLSISLFSLKFLLMLFTGILFGALGGIFGGSAAQKRRRRRRTRF